jgi:hypothetical protein
VPAPRLARYPVLLVAVPVLLLGMVAGTAMPASAVRADARLEQASVPVPGQLNAVAATSASSAWAVGFANGEALVEHWNGKAWKFVSVLRLGASGDLYGVAAVSARNAWAVGYLPGPTGSATLIAHWNGTTWKRVASPNPGPDGSILQSVATTSASNAWAVGESGGEKTVIVHWNGRAWKRVASPSPGAQGSFLYGVTATSATNAWAVGYADNQGTFTSLILHWNGKVWTRVPSANPAGQPVLYGVTATSGKNAWAVGYTAVHAEAFKTLIEHWNGKTWKQVPSPDPVTVSASALTWNILQSVSATSARSAWAAGYSEKALQGSKTMILHWNGTAWKKAASPNPFCATCDSLFGVVASSASRAWAVGTLNTGGEAVILRWNGAAWRNFPSAPEPDKAPGLRPARSG